MSELKPGQEAHMPPIAVRERLRAQFRAFSRAGDVVRFHTRPQLQPQNVGSHSYGVAWLLWLLMGGKPSAALLYAGLAHDVPEFITGDVPAPVKRRISGAEDSVHQLEAEVLAQAQLPIPELTEDEQRLLKLADCLEGMRHCCKERQLGNQLMESCFKRYQTASRELLVRPHEEYIWGFINQCWREANQ